MGRADSYGFRNIGKSELRQHILIYSLPASVTLGKIIDMQSELIHNKEKVLQVDGSEEEKRNALLAEQLLRVAMEKESLIGQKTLGSGEYTVRVDAMVGARRLVGGIEIEQV